DEGDPGEIRDGHFYIEDGAVILTSTSGDFLASQPLFPGQDPAQLARSLLRSSEDKSASGFNRPLPRPTWGIALGRLGLASRRDLFNCAAKTTRAPFN